MKQVRQVSNLDDLNSLESGKTTGWGYEQLWSAYVRAVERGWDDATSLRLFSANDSIADSLGGTPLAGSRRRLSPSRVSARVRCGNARVGWVFRDGMRFTEYHVVQADNRSRPLLVAGFR